MAKLYRVGTILLDEGTLSLRVGDHRIALDPKPFGIVLYLALNAKRMVSNQDIKNAVWNGDVKDETYRVTLSTANLKFKDALRKANPEVEPVIFYTRPKPNYLQWAMGTVEEITPEPASVPPPSPELPATPTIAPKKSKWKQWSAVAIILILLFGLAASALRSTAEISQVSRIRIEADTLVALDQRGAKMWQHTFPEGLGLYPTDEVALRTQYVTVDLDGDNHNELVFIQKSPPPGALTKVTKLVCFQGNEIKTVIPGHGLVMGPDPKGDRYTRPYGIAKVLVIPGKPHPKIAITTLHHEDAPSQVLILDHNFKIVGDYWHPGHLSFMELGDIDQDGRVELLLGGVNNRHHSATLIALDPDNVSGTTRPIDDPRIPDHKAFGLLQYGDDENHLRDIPPGTEKYVVLFPRSYLAFEGKRSLHFYNRVNQIQTSVGHLTVVVAESESPDDEINILYDLDWRLNVMQAKPSKKFQDKQWERFQKRTLDHPFSKRDIDQLEKNVVVVKYR